MSLAFHLESDPGAVPLVIGVVGHRDPDPSALADLAHTFRSLLQDLQVVCPLTPIWLLTGMAAGIDLLAADVFLQVARNRCKDGQSRYSQLPPDRLIAVLPKTWEEYSTDFLNPDDLVNCKRLLSFADVVVDPSSSAELCGGICSVPADADCYYRQGQYIAKYSYLLFSFSNGFDTGLLGGTAQTVALHQGHLHSQFRALADVIPSREPGPLISIDTPRISDRSIPSPSRSVCGSMVLPIQVIGFCAYLRKINAVILDPDRSPVQYSPAEGTLTRLWSYADLAACQSKSQYEKVVIVLVALGFLLVTIASMQSRFASAMGMLLVFAAAIFFPSIQKRIQTPFILSRVLAECLAAQYLLRVNGLLDSVPDLLRSFGHPGLDRIRVVLRAVELQLSIDCALPEPMVSDATYESRFDRARAWLHAQVLFMSNRIRLFRGRDLLWIRLSCALAGLAVIVPFLALFPSDDTSSMVVSILLAAFASSAAYRELMGFRRTCDRYETSRARFSRALEALDYLDPSRLATEAPEGLCSDRYRTVIRAVGLEKIDELNEWTVGQLEASYVPM